MVFDQFGHYMTHEQKIKESHLDVHHPTRDLVRLHTIGLYVCYLNPF